jgi:hypothetical protein
MIPGNFLQDNSFMDPTPPKPTSALCKHCGGAIAIRNPTGNCDHLCWPDALTEEAKLANGFRLVTRQAWEPNSEADRT